MAKHPSALPILYVKKRAGRLGFDALRKAVTMRVMTQLYTHGGSAIHDSDFLEALRSLGVEEGDTLFIHSDVRVFGRLMAPAETLLSSLIDVFKESVGPHGTIIMPTFTYSFGRGEVFDVERSRSTVGSLTDFFRTRDSVIRSRHPMFSVAVWGAKAESFRETSKDSFGPGSAFDIFHRAKGKIVLFGVDFNVCTFLHYVEQAKKVPYRFMKTFTGKSIDAGRTYEDACTYFVRPLDGSIDNDMMRIEPYMREEGAVQSVQVGAGAIKLIAADDVYRIAMRVLDHDPYALLATSPEHI